MIFISISIVFFQIEPKREWQLFLYPFLSLLKHRRIFFPSYKKAYQPCAFCRYIQKRKPACRRPPIV
ncbi:hypothetical protein BN871_FU_00020 [Paenibacillus sp. P22]|nr:hypothetical protein BN871_FU_00020 [Paenibacillus sp. P22]